MPSLIILKGGAGVLLRTQNIIHFKAHIQVLIIIKKSHFLYSRVQVFFEILITRHFW